MNRQPLDRITRMLVQILIDEGVAREEAFQIVMDRMVRS